MIDELLEQPRVVVDTAPLIYFLSGSTSRAAPARKLLLAAARGETEVLMSALTEAELLVAPLRLEDPTPAVETIRDLIAGPPALDVRDVSRPIARRAARIRAEWNLRLADAVIAATAAETGSSALLGNDKRFVRLAIDGLKYFHVDDLVTPPPA